MSEPPHVLREYAVLADGERGALIGPRGDIAWLCFPGWADPAVLASLIGGAGEYAITPRGRWVWGGYYEPDTLIWRSRWITDEGIVECREALAFPGDRDRAVLLRQVLAKSGTARLTVRCAPAADYGRARCTHVRRDDDGAWHGRIGDARFRWDGATTARENDGVLEFDLDLEAGQTHDLVLTLATGDCGAAPDAATAWTATETAWEEQVPSLHATVAPRDAGHAHAVLCGLTSATGAMVAATTLGLPERADEGRSFDYRYAWIRDQALVGQSVAAAGSFDLLDRAVRFVRARVLEHGPDLAPAYTIGGGRVPDQEELGLPGYPGGAAIVGNHVNVQFQLDAFGEVLCLLATAATHDRAEADDWRAIEIAADAIGARRHEPDAGIWELSPAHWTHSKLICAAGLRRVASLPEAGARSAGWLALADALLAEASRTCLRPDGAWSRAPDDDRVDGALLLPPLRGTPGDDDPRTRATLAAIEAELAEDHMLYRYRPDARRLGEAEGAFLLCGFAMALALEQQGRRADALRWFERNRSACGTPGLLAEEFDVRQRQMRGNLPQAFVHGLLLEASARLAQ